MSAIFFERYSQWKEKIASEKGRIYCAKEITFFLFKYEHAKFYLADFLPSIRIFSFNSPGEGITTGKSQNLGETL